MKSSLFVLACLLAPMAHAEIPQPIIDECNAMHSGSYFNMPDCLKGGAVAYDMLAIVKQADFYGPDVQRVIDGCRETNESTQAVWWCVRDAAESAAETREMIGKGNMQDECYRLISDPDAFTRLDAPYSEIVELYYGYKMSDRDLIRLSIASMGSPFYGCPIQEITQE